MLGSMGRALTPPVGSMGRDLTPPVASMGRVLTPPVGSMGRVLTPLMGSMGRVLTPPAYTTGPNDIKGLVLSVIYHKYDINGIKIWSILRD